MKFGLTLCPLLLLTASCEAQAPKYPAVKIANDTHSTEILLTAKDGVKVFGTYYQASQPKALILLFHQADSNKNEYATIAPRLAAEGYSAMAIDQRSGGKNFGARNQTVDTLGKEGEFMDAKLDMEAALNWATDKKLPVVLWGSSYSAAFTYVLAADNPGKVTAALAFSGGDYLDKGQVMKAVGKINIPLFATSPRSEIAEMRPILERAPSADKTFFVAKTSGVHGSSILIPSENPKGAEENWVAVLAFLDRVIPK
jgi:dienelactone hydrolase